MERTIIILIRVLLGIFLEDLNDLTTTIRWLGWHLKPLRSLGMSPFMADCLGAIVFCPASAG